MDVRLHQFVALAPYCRHRFGSAHLSHLLALHRHVIKINSLWYVLYHLYIILSLLLGMLLFSAPLIPYPRHQHYSVHLFTNHVTQSLYSSHFDTPYSFPLTLTPKYTWKSLHFFVSLLHLFQIFMSALWIRVLLLFHLNSTCFVCSKFLYTITATANRLQFAIVLKYYNHFIDMACCWFACHLLLMFVLLTTGARLGLQIYKTLFMRTPPLQAFEAASAVQPRSNLN
jgi:hypothetical protein